MCFFNSIRCLGKELKTARTTYHGSSSQYGGFGSLCAQFVKPKTFSETLDHQSFPSIKREHLD